MIKNYIKHVFLFGLFLLIMLTSGQHASAETVIADSANMLTSEETEELKGYCDTILNLYDTSIYIVTSDKIGKQDNFEDYMEEVGNAKDAPKNLVLLFISTKKDNHVYQIFGYGKAETYMTNDRCNKVMDHMQNDLTDKEYFNALKTFCEEVQRYMSKDPRFDSLIFNPVAHLIFAFILSLVIVFCMVRNTAGKNTTTVATYIDNNHSRLLGRIDHFTHMTVSHEKKNTNNSGRSSGGGGRSHSSGNSHSF